MTTAGTDINKVNMVAQMKAIRDAYNSGIVWWEGSHPFNTGASNDYGSILPTSGGTSNGYALGAIENDIPGTDVIASTIVSNFRSYASSLSRVRYARLIRWYNTNGSNGVTYDSTQMTSLRAGYAADMSGVGISNVTATADITAANLDQFVANLSATINSVRNSTVTYNEYYCHSSCHGNCHGSI